MTRVCPLWLQEVNIPLVCIFRASMAQGLSTLMLLSPRPTWKDDPYILLVSFAMEVSIKVPRVR